jgi:DNA gyrase subunit A
MEPVVLPSRFPNLLVNGSSGIAVGMATNIPPHNLTEVINGIIAMIDNPEITIEELSKIIKGPDFPTAGTILGKQGIRDYFTTGRGRIVVRAEAEIEQTSNNRQRIIVKDLPYQVNKARLIERIADMVKDKRLEGIADINDESDRTEEVRIVITLKRDANANVVLNQLYKNTQLQDSFSVNMLALVQMDDGKFEPKVIGIREALQYYLKHQQEVITRRTRFDLEKAEARAHILEGLRIAIDNLDEVISIIRNSRTEAIAKQGLAEKFGLSDRQTQAIVDMRLGRLTGLERDKLEAEYNEIMEKIQYYKNVLSDDTLLDSIIKDELLVINNKYGDERRTKITASEDEIELEDLIDEEESVITLTHFGYIKRLPADTYKSQRRGGKGIAGLSTREEDFVETLFITSTHHYIMFFTNMGRVYRLKAYQIPEAGRQAKGTAIVNLLELEGEEKITAVIPIAEYKEGLYLFMATKQGHVKKTDLMQYSNIRRSGLAAVTLRENDELIDVRLTDGERDIILVTRNGLSIRFNERDVRPLGRVSQGVIGINLQDDDYVIGMATSRPGATLLVVTENGFGKRTELDEYKTQTRAGKGILTYRVTEKTGKVVGVKLVDETDDIMLISFDGTIIRMEVSGISILGRATQGVTLMRTSEDNHVVSIARIEPEDDDEEDHEGEDPEAGEEEGEETGSEHNEAQDDEPGEHNDEL